MVAAKGLASPLADGIAQFIVHKRMLGFRFEAQAYGLRLLDRYLVERRVGVIADVTPEVVGAFLASRPRLRPQSYNQLLGILRRFFDWLVAREIVAGSPVLTPTRRVGGARIPFIFAPEQARQLLDLASRLPSGRGVELRGPTFHAVFATLYGLGLRVSEACHLNVGDVDRMRHLLVIRNTKFGKDRLVPFGPRMAEMLDGHVALRRARHPGLADDEPLFSVRGGRRLTRRAIGLVFQKLLPRLRLDVPPGASHPHVHDMRHSFAVGTLLRWYRAGVDPAERLLHLSIFLGHAQPEATAVYLTTTANLLAEAGNRFESFAHPLVTELR